MTKKNILIALFTIYTLIANAQFTDPSKNGALDISAGFRVEELFQFIRTSRSDFELKSSKKDWIEESKFYPNTRDGELSFIASFNPKGKIEAFYYYTGEASAMAPWARFDYDEQGKLLNIIGLSVVDERTLFTVCTIDNAKNQIRMYSDSQASGFYDKSIASIKRDASGHITSLKMKSDEASIEYKMEYDAKGRMTLSMIFITKASGVAGISRNLTYNAQGFVQNETIILNPETDNATTLAYTYEYEYDKDLDWITKRCYINNGELQYTVKRSFERPEHMMKHIYNN